MNQTRDRKKNRNQQSYQTVSERISWFDEIIQFVQDSSACLCGYWILIQNDLEIGEYLPFNLQIDVEIKCSIQNGKSSVSNSHTIYGPKHKVRQFYELKEFQCFQNWFLNLSGERARDTTKTHFETIKSIKKRAEKYEWQMATTVYHCLYKIHPKGSLKSISWFC